MWDYICRLLNRWYTTNNSIGETRVVREYELNSNVLKINLTFVNHCRYSKILIFELPLEKKPKSSFLCKNKNNSNANSMVKSR